MDTSWIKVGAVVKVKANTAGHALPIGTRGVVTSVAVGTPVPGQPDYRQIRIKDQLTGLPYNVYLYPADLEPDILTQNDLLTKMIELETRVADLHDKILWMRENKKEVFNEIEYKVWRTVQVVETLPDTQARVDAVKDLLLRRFSV